MPANRLPTCKVAHPAKEKAVSTSVTSRAYVGCGGTQPPRPTFDQSSGLIYCNPPPRNIAASCARHRPGRRWSHIPSLFRDGARQKLTPASLNHRIGLGNPPPRLGAHPTVGTPFQGDPRVPPDVPRHPAMRLARADPVQHLHQAGQLAIPSHRLHPGEEPGGPRYSRSRQCTAPIAECAGRRSARHGSPCPRETARLRLPPPARSLAGTRP